MVKNSFLNLKPDIDVRHYALTILNAFDLSTHLNHHITFLFNKKIMQKVFLLNLASSEVDIFFFNGIQDLIISS